MFVSATYKYYCSDIGTNMHCIGLIAVSTTHALMAGVSGNPIFEKMLQDFIMSWVETPEAKEDFCCIGPRDTLCTAHSLSASLHGMQFLQSSKDHTD